MNKNENYLNYKNLIYKIAWQKKKKNPLIEIDDLISEGNIIYCKCLKNYNNLNVKFSTYLYSCLNHGLKNFIKEERKFLKVSDIENNNIKYFQDFSFFELSENSKLILDELQNTPLTKTNTIRKMNLKKHIRKKFNLKHIEISNSFAEIKECLI